MGLLLGAPTAGALGLATGAAATWQKEHPTLGLTARFKLYVGCLFGSQQSHEWQETGHLILPSVVLPEMPEISQPTYTVLQTALILSR